MDKFKSGLFAQPSPGWLGFLGFCMTLSSIWLIPAYGIYLYTKTEGTPKERFAKISSAKDVLPKSLSSTRQKTTSQEITYKTSVNATALWLKMSFRPKLWICSRFIGENYLILNLLPPQVATNCHKLMNNLSPKKLEYMVDIFNGRVLVFSQLITSIYLNYKGCYELDCKIFLNFG